MNGFVVVSSFVVGGASYCWIIGGGDISVGCGITRAGCSGAVVAFVGLIALALFAFCRRNSSSCVGQSGGAVRIWLAMDPLIRHRID